MATIPGSVPITGFVAPTDTTDTFASHDEIYGRGGYRSVADITARDAITADRRAEGMLVNCRDTGIIYQLIGGILNSNWVEFSAGSTGGDVLTKSAGEDISQFKVVKIENNLAYLGKASVAEDNTKIIGISLSGATAGNNIRIQTFGELSESTWNWTAGSIFVGDNGELTQTPPTGFILKIGKILSPTKILINIQQAIVRT